MLYWVAHSPGFLSKQDLVAVREKSVVECTVNPALYASQCMTGLSPVMALKATPSHLKEVVNDRITSLHCLDTIFDPPTFDPLSSNKLATTLTLTWTHIFFFICPFTIQISTN